ncbi:DNA alkylation repair protein [Planococcus donghaensis]|uniref:DNA alkylation repair protein n=1 Tax=Planococcus donghaensis TaxID=414778 RepID=A0A1C7EHB9_9BACL|nr:DNA alkylation repair protein [Planococcus donghaensis]ANU23115.1 DNA alkylation repair protein [Planococcus donghaensis]
MNSETVMQELEALGKERTKKNYLSNGAREPLFGVTTGSMKTIAKKIKIDQQLAEQLYATGNYDAMYFAGIIADPKAMTAEDFNRWIEDAYFYMIADFVVAVTLSESDIAQEVADQWIASGEELKMSAGWSCYCWLLGNRSDEEFSRSKISDMLDTVEKNIHSSPPRTKSSMNNFLYTVGISFQPLNDKAVEVSKRVGIVEIERDNKKNSRLNAYESIQTAMEKGRLGFKRKYVRC